MKASELIRLLSEMPSDTEIIIGDPDTGVFWDPAVRPERVATYWQVAEDFPEEDVHSVRYFDRPEAAQRRTEESSLDVTGPTEIQALNIAL